MTDEPTRRIPVAEDFDTIRARLAELRKEQDRLRERGLEVSLDEIAALGLGEGGEGGIPAGWSGW